MDTEFPGRFKRLFAGPMWSGCQEQDIGYIHKVSEMQFWAQYLVSNEPNLAALK